MTWQLSGTLRYVRYDIDPLGRRSLHALAKSTITFDTKAPANTGLQALVDRLSGARFQSLPQPRGTGALTNLLSEWQLYSTTALPAWPAEDSLGRASTAQPTLSHVAVELLTTTAYRAALSARVAVPAAQFEVIFTLFQQSLGHPRVRYTLGLANPFAFPASPLFPGLASSATDFLAGTMLLFSPATVAVSLRPPRRSGATHPRPPVA